MIHQFDEYVYPGGFKEFVNELQTKDKNSDFPLNDKNTFYINIMFIWLLYPVLTVIGSLFSFVILPAIAIMVTVINSTLHVIVAIKMRKPNPGFFASLFINLPIGLYVLIYLVLFQIINGFELIIIIVIGFILHSFLFVFIFRLKKKNMQKQVE
ncbi:MAG: HXXEE domain-containing protein [Promethearchaeota archaeon]